MRWPCNDENVRESNSFRRIYEGLTKVNEGKSPEEAFKGVACKMVRCYKCPLIRNEEACQVVLRNYFEDE